MCGIAGIVRWNGSSPSIEDVQAMCDVIDHRGPDDEGFYQDDFAILGMRRLSIIDLQTGHQPVSNEDGTVWVVLNGEIYNFKELRRDLESRGHRFSTTSDTETIVHLYEDFGADAIQRLRGMFGLAIWDSRRDELLLARDRLGIKPVYYARIGGGIAFASELKSLLQMPQIERRLSWEALSHFLSLGWTSEGRSIIEGVFKLKPGHLLKLSKDGLRIDKYWSIQFSQRQASENDLVEELRELLRESVSLHLRSDVPLGAFLSGGIDSSAVVATMANLLSAPVKTFAIGSGDPEFDELKYARVVARAFRTEHYELVLEPHTVQVLDDLAWFQDEPLADTSLIPTYMVSKLAAEHVKVVLSGDGGDEIFGGYDKYLVEQQERRRDNLPRFLLSTLGALSRVMPEGMKGRRFLQHFSYEGSRRYLDSVGCFSPEEQYRLLEGDVRAQMWNSDPIRQALVHLEKERDWLSAVQYWDLQAYLPLDILPKVDRMTMAHSIEARPALLDHRLVEFALSLPSDMRIRGKTTKYLFRRAMRGLLPDLVIDRPKRGFTLPLGHWLRGDWSGYVRELLLSDTSRKRGIFRPAYISRLLSLHERGRDLNVQLWALASFELWCRTFLDHGGRGRMLPRTFKRAPLVSRPKAAVR
jgi:asparagine synthase (glutamine-hydrolysing)